MLAERRPIARQRQRGALVNMDVMTPISRRDFAKAAALAGVGVAAATSRAASTTTRAATRAATTRTTAPSTRIRLGFIGVGNRGDTLLNAFLAHDDAQVVAVSDVYLPYLDAAAKKIGDGVAPYSDYRRLFDRKDVDAVVIATPDHWHALQTIHACQAGKDVFVEKPLSLCVAEGRAMVSAARRHKRVTQVGLHRRSSDVCREVAELIRGGAIGNVTVARSFHIQNESPHGIGRHAHSEPPRDLDWDRFLGPAPLRPYNVNRGLYRFRWS